MSYMFSKIQDDFSIPSSSLGCLLIVMWASTSQFFKNAHIISPQNSIWIITKQQKQPHSQLIIACYLQIKASETSSMSSKGELFSWLSQSSISHWFSAFWCNFKTTHLLRTIALQNHKSQQHRQIRTRFYVNDSWVCSNSVSQDPFNYLSFYSSIHPPTHPAVYLSSHPAIHLSMHLILINW